MAKVLPPPVHLIAPIQLAILILLVSIIWYFISADTACSALTGGLIQILPQAWFTRRAYRYTSARQLQYMVRSMYQAETGKIVFTAALFAIVFVRYKTVEPLPLFLTFGAMILVQLFAASRLLKRKQ